MKTYIIFLIFVLLNCRRWDHEIPMLFLLFKWSVRRLKKATALLIKLLSLLISIIIFIHNLLSVFILIFTSFQENTTTLYVFAFFIFEQSLFRLALFVFFLLFNGWVIFVAGNRTDILIHIALFAFSPFGWHSIKK